MPQREERRPHRTQRQRQRTAVLGEKLPLARTAGIGRNRTPDDCTFSGTPNSASEEAFFNHTYRKPPHNKTVIPPIDQCVRMTCTKLLQALLDGNLNSASATGTAVQLYCCCSELGITRWVPPAHDDSIDPPAPALAVVAALAGRNDGRNDATGPIFGFS